MLFGVPRTHLPRMLLPIGEFEKPKVREMAKQFGLPVFNKPDSQEICFVPDNDYAGLVESRRPGAALTGAVVDGGGRKVGEHGGQHRFTIGQRRGLDVALGYRIYVTGKDPATNTVTVGPKEDLMRSACTAGEANWLIDPPKEWMPVRAQYRYNSDAVSARVRAIADAEGGTHSGRKGRFEVRFDEPQEAVAPGQAVVLYDHATDTTLLGGGWITTTEKSANPPDDAA